MSSKSQQTWRRDPLAVKDDAAGCLRLTRACSNDISGSPVCIMLTQICSIRAVLCLNTYSMARKKMQNLCILLLCQCKIILQTQPRSLVCPYPNPCMALKKACSSGRLATTAPCSRHTANVRYTANSHGKTNDNNIHVVIPVSRLLSTRSHRIGYRPYLINP
jgi:hypothetical protein